MDVKAINNVSLLNFAGKSKKSEKKNIKNENPQMDEVMSKKSANGMKSLAYTAILLGAATAGMGTTSCVKENAWAYADTNSEAKADALVIGGNCGGKRDTTIIHDTVPVFVRDTITNNITDTIYVDRTDTIYSPVFETVYVKEYPYGLADSLLRQGINIDIPLDGPMPNDNNEIVFVASKAYNRYENKLYETRVDSLDTNGEKLSLVTKVTDRHDPENPKISWLKSHVIDVPGKGIQIDRYSYDGSVQPNKYQQGLWRYYGSEIRSNGGRGNNPGVNTVYDASGNMIWKGEYTNKGQQAKGEFLYGTIAHDDVTGEPYFDENGKPERIKYDFNNGKMWSDKVDFTKATNSYFGK